MFSIAPMTSISSFLTHRHVFDYCLQVNRAMNFFQGILVDPHTFAKEHKEILRSASDRRRNRGRPSGGSKWNLPKIQSLRLATPSRATIHLAMCKQELSKNKMLLNVDMGLPYCALNMPTITTDDDDGEQLIEGEEGILQQPITRSVSSQF